jgi:hypothetical protein
MLMLMVVLIITLALFSLVDPKSKKVQLEQRTQESLSRAKEALIAYAITYYDQEPGVFVQWPCVDDGSNPEGEQAANCHTNNANIVGKLPWKELDISPLKDSSGECLWLVISGHYKNNNSAMLLNEDSSGLLRLYASDGATELTANTPQGRLVAAIIAPGPPLAWQNRTNDPAKECRGDYNAAAYLEAVGLADNANLDNAATPYSLDEIAQGDESSQATINDRIIAISQAEIWDAVRNRNYANLAIAGNSPYPADIFTEFTRQLAQCIADFGLIHGGGDLRLPWAVPVDLGTPSSQLYSQQTNYKDESGKFGGRFPYDIDISMANAGHPLTVSPNPPFTSQAQGKLFFEGRCSEFVDINPPFPAPIPAYQNLWNHWKDHVFYAVAEARAPNSANPSQPCGAAPNRCLSVNGAGDYAAIIMFAGSALTGQSREAPPDVDNKALALNYLDDAGGNHANGNAAVLDAENGDGDYQNNPGANFNDIFFCIDQNLNVVNC